MHLYEKKGRYIIDFTDIPAVRAKMPELPVEERRGNFKEVETGFSEAAAVAEAKRCLSCRRCLGCALCWAECKPEAIDFGLPDLDRTLDVDEIVLTSGMERRIAPISGNLANKHMNVVTDLQVERMLAETGPTNGLVLRPQDGELPRRIAWVQPWKASSTISRDSAIILGINEMILMRRKNGHAFATLISPDMDPFEDDFQGALPRDQQVELINGNVLEAAGTGDNGDIRLTYDVGGVKKAEHFELIVVITRPLLPEHIETVADSVGLKLGYEDFLAKPGRVLPTRIDGVRLAQNM